MRRSLLLVDREDCSHGEEEKEEAYGSAESGDETNACGRESFTNRWIDVIWRKVR
jgi:hypothetical protein